MKIVSKMTIDEFDVKCWVAGIIKESLGHDVDPEQVVLNIPNNEIIASYEVEDSPSAFVKD